MDFYSRLCFVVVVVGIGLFQDCASVRKSGYWPKGVIPYEMDIKFPSDIQSAVLSAMRQIEMSVNTDVSPCVRFVKKTSENYVLKIKHNPGCYSSVGYSKGGPNYMSVGRGCETKGILLHTLHHVLGFYHEHNRPDRDHHITINYANLKHNMKHHFDKVPGMDTFGYPYDYTSISHIGPYHFAMNSRIPLVKPSHSVGADVVMGQREKLSIHDVLKIQKAYDCKEDISYVFTYSRDELVNCHFGKGMCNLTPGSNSQFNFVVKTGSVSNGPYAGHSTGIDSYLVATDEQKHKAKVATLVSPLSKGGPLCLDFYLYQKGPSSYLDIVISEAGIVGIPFRSYRGANADHWKRVTVGVNAPDSTKVQVTLMAHIDSGAVAVDDFKIYHGQCAP